MNYQTYLFGCNNVYILDKVDNFTIYLARVALSWFMVLLKEIYLNNFNQAQNTLIAKMGRNCKNKHKV